MNVNISSANRHNDVSAFIFLYDTSLCLFGDDIMANTEFVNLKCVAYTFGSRYNLHEKITKDVWQLN